MARTKRTNYAKVKIWTESMTADVEGSIAGVAVEVFRSCPNLKAMDAALAKMQAIRVQQLDRESAPQEV